MNILKKLGVVVALHLAILALVYLPACQSSSAYASRSAAANSTATTAAGPSAGSPTAATAPTTTTAGLSRVEIARTLTPVTAGNANLPIGPSAQLTAASQNTTYVPYTPPAPAPAASGVIYTYPASTESFAAPVVAYPAPPTTATPATATTQDSGPRTQDAAALADQARQRPIQNPESKIQNPSPSALPAETPANTTQLTHTVVANDSPWKIARKYGITTAALLAANNFPPNSSPTLQPGQKLIIPAKAAAPAASSAVPGTIIYKVKLNDNLSAIAARNNTTAERIMALNKLTSPVIRVDQELLLPAIDAASNNAPYAADATPAATAAATGTTITYVVKPGDNLSTIAAYYGASRNEIATLNHIPNPNKLPAGARLTIPNAKKNLPAPAAQPATTPAPDSLASTANTTASSAAATATATSAAAAAAQTAPDAAPAFDAATQIPAGDSPISPSPISPISPAPASPTDSPIAPASPSPITPAPAPSSPPVNVPLPFGTQQN